jgi:hypothetical protein
MGVTLVEGHDFLREAGVKITFSEFAQKEKTSYGTIFVAALYNLWTTVVNGYYRVPHFVTNSHDCRFIIM